MPPIEPSMARFPNPFVRYFAATRPAFLSVTLAGAFIGLASAIADGIAIDTSKAFLTVFFALIAHAGANVVNDYYDSLSGADAANENRLFPFTGGSRFIQNGVLTLRETRNFGYALLVVVIPAGLWLTYYSASGLIVIGLLGLLIAWAYSAPPLKLMSRGVGEGAITAGWLLVVLGTDFVQRGAFSTLPLLAGLPFALLVAAILYINQFPDREADAQVGKRTLVVRLGPGRASWGYVVLTVLAYFSLLLAILFGKLPLWSAMALLPAILSFNASRQLLVDSGHPERLGSAIKLTISAANLNGILLSAGLAISGTF